MNKLPLIITLMIFLGATKCENYPPDKDFEHYKLINNSGHGIYVTRGLGTKFQGDHGPAYPDTSIIEEKPRSGYLRYIESGDTAVSGGGYSLEDFFNANLPSDTLSLYIFHEDTVAAYEWEIIRDKYKILRRFDLSLEDIKRLNNEIYYPPTLEMEGIRMYPR